ncbi:right-handed parallel beta-helix repeat-containing protein [Streptoverticillium reticulum]|uniref:right-handed parallel beta-helix repeat-containing protein n=1 Tax=Streptoverticillium reticulum TaxID=1433415 RepID=UPI0039BF2998
MKKTFVCLAAATAALGCSVSAYADTQSKRVKGIEYYVDCSEGSDSAPGTSPNTAWKTLDRLDKTTFKPGDTINFRKGSTCSGTLAPSGSGTDTAPVVVRSYGSGTERPKIVGNGARAAIHLRNVQGWEIHDLDVSDPGGDAGATRTGIYVELSDFGTGRHYVIDNVVVHDVNGCDCTAPGEPSGGIVFNATGSATPSGFDGIKVSNNKVNHVEGIGIGTSSMWARRPVYPGGPGTSFVPMTGVVVENNELTDLGGDGITMQNGSHALLQKNVVKGFGLRATTDHAGVWAWNSDYTVVQFNDVSGGDAGSHGAFAFDIDGGNKDSLYQYNFSHDNSGMMLVCAVPGLVSDGQTVRYNISQNDRAVSSGVMVVACTPQTNTRIYNNVVYAPGATTLVNNMGEFGATFSDNIFVGKNAAINDTHSTFTHNAYTGVSTVPSGDKGAVTGDPGLLSPGTATSLGTADGYRLGTDSQALKRGAVVAGNGGRDYFGHPVSPTCPPNIGVYQGPGIG